MSAIVHVTFCDWPGWHGWWEWSHLLVKIRVAAADVADVALEVLDVDCVEAHNGRVEAHVLLRQAVAEVEGPAGFGEICLCAVERGEEGFDR